MLRSDYNQTTTMPTETKDAWPIDGYAHNDVRPEALYQTPAIREFLASDRWTVLISAKGMGKTLLLRVKKYQMERDGSGVDIIPRDAQFDIPTIPTNLAHGAWDDTELWSALWQSSIVFSILSHQWQTRLANAVSDPIWNLIEELEIPTGFKQTLTNDLLQRSQKHPSYYLNLILAHNIGVIRRFSNSLRIVHQIASRYITNAKAVFIDGFDHTLQTTFSDDLDSWKSAQNGLLKASHKLSILNPHIKTFITLRQEAFAGFVDADKEVIRGKSILLSYNYDQLQDMFLHAIRRYTSCSTFKDFFTVDSIKNLYYKNVNEPPFGYVYRHSTGTPRCILGLGRELARLELWKQPGEDPQKAIRLVVNRESGSYVADDYLQTQRQFLLQTLRDKDILQQFFRLIPTNVLRFKDLVAITTQFSELRGLRGEHHPFCELFNIGLLGAVSRNHGVNELVQNFKKPFEFSWQHEHLLQDNRTYFLHPSLYDAISFQNESFLINCGALVGDGCRVIPDKKLFPSIFLSYSSKDKEFVTKIKPQLDGMLSLRTPVDFWIDIERIKLGEVTNRALESGVRESDLVLLFVSRASLESKWVEKEWRSKYEDEVNSGRIKVITVFIDDTRREALPSFLGSKNYRKLPQDSSDTKEKLEELADAIASLLRTSRYFKSRTR